MISSHELDAMESVLRKLDLGRFEDLHDKFDGAAWFVYRTNYCVAYSNGGYYDEELEDELLELSEEELRIMSVYDDGYGSWYDRKLSDHVSDVLLDAGEDDE